MPPPSFVLKNVAPAIEGQLGDQFQSILNMALKRWRSIGTVCLGRQRDACITD